jgi:tryptophanyl-tRNA synthetase
MLQRNPAPQITGPTPASCRVISLYTPSGRATLGNLLGSFRHSAALQQEAGTECVFGISDLHALTSTHDPAVLAAQSRELACLAIAAGIDPVRSPFILQSQVPAHAELSYLMESTAHYGELARMIQFKEKSTRSSSVRASLLTYPALMAADILLYQCTEVSVGADQAQHVELARDLAIRFNQLYGQVFTVPRAVHSVSATRVMDLSDPTSKMSKSVESPGTIFLTDPPEVVRRKVMRAVTDSESDVRYDPATKPGVSNLLDILSACTGTPIDALSYDTYGALKRDVADAVVTLLEPLQTQFKDLSNDSVALEAIFNSGAARATSLAAPTLAAAKRAMGLIPAATG